MPSAFPSGGCSIYSARPDVCRTWYCAWRRLECLEEQWRPDRSKVLIQVREDNAIVLQPLGDPKHVLLGDAADLIAGWIAAGVPVYLSIRARAGFTSVLVDLNCPSFEGAVQSGDRDRIRSMLSDAIDFGLASKTVPIAIALL